LSQTIAPNTNKVVATMASGAGGSHTGIWACPETHGSMSRDKSQATGSPSSTPKASFGCERHNAAQTRSRTTTVTSVHIERPSLFTPSVRLGSVPGGRDRLGEEVEARELRVIALDD